MRFERIGQIMDVDDDMADPRRLDPVEAMVDQRLARDAHQRLWPCCGERSHPFAEPRRHHHRAFDLRAHFAIAFQISARFLSGTLASRSEERRVGKKWVSTCKY